MWLDSCPQSGALFALFLTLLGQAPRDTGTLKGQQPLSSCKKFRTRRRRPLTFFVIPYKLTSTGFVFVNVVM
jgi:hypothetical protein